MNFTLKLAFGLCASNILVMLGNGLVFEFRTEFTPLSRLDGDERLATLAADALADRLVAARLGAGPSRRSRGGSVTVGVQR